MVKFLKFFLYQIYIYIPNGILKSKIKNIINYLLYSLSFQVQTVTIRGIKIKCYKDLLTSNEQLVIEESGYNVDYKLRKGDIVIDIGPYTGLFTIYAGKKVGSTGKVIAFELDPYNCIILRRNIRLNNLKNVIVINKGIYKYNTYLPVAIHGVGSAISDSSHPVTTIKTVEVATLDSEMKRLGVKKIDFIKMDIEGAEIEAVKGMKDIINNNKKINLAIASYHVVNGKQTYLYLQGFFKKLGMKTVTKYPKHLTTYVSY